MGDTPTTSKETKMEKNNPIIQQAIEQKLNELEQTSPSSEQNISRETRRYALEQIAEMETTEAKAIKGIKEATLPGIFQLSMF